MVHSPLGKCSASTIYYLDRLSVTNIQVIWTNADHLPIFSMTIEKNMLKVTLIRVVRLPKIRKGGTKRPRKLTQPMAEAIVERKRYQDCAIDDRSI